jgi:hypothetical protein
MVKVSNKEKANGLAFGDAEEGRTECITGSERLFPTQQHTTQSRQDW